MKRRIFVGSSKTLVIGSLAIGIIESGVDVDGLPPIVEGSGVLPSVTV